MGLPPDGLADRGEPCKNPDTAVSLVQGQGVSEDTILGENCVTTIPRIEGAGAVPIPLSGYTQRS
jgi:hypothetical protein